MMTVSNADTASIRRRDRAGTRSTKNVTPTFSPRASALAAPKKLEPTIRPRATSSDHSTGALNSERNVTEPITTARSAASNTAATASVTVRKKRRGGLMPASGGDAPMLTLQVSDARRFNLVDDGLGVG